MMKDREGYKMTELGEIPEEWKVEKLCEIGEILMGQSPVGDSYNSCGDGLPLLNGPTEFTNKSPIPKQWTTKPTKICQNNDILFCVRGSSTGRMNISNDKYCIGRGLAAIRGKEGVSITTFIYYFLQISIERILNLSAGSTFPNVSRDDLSGISCILPCLKEQQIIGDILSTVDEHIEETESLIEKIKELKKGLMQRLLTKGIGHTKFKKTEVGEIPVEWQVKRISDICETTSGGTPNRSNKEYYYNGSIPWIKTGELIHKYIWNTEEKITESAVKNSSAKIINPNTVLVAMYGATIGKISITKIGATTNQACCAIIPNENLLNYEYLYYILLFNKANIIKMGAGGAQPNISQQLLKQYFIPLPGLEEQTKIESILSEIDEEINEYESKKQKIMDFKKGLMHKLLTGKIRVKI